MLNKGLPILDITFIIADQKEVHEGVVRPFVNFAKALKNNYEVSLLLVNCSSIFFENMKKVFPKVIISQNEKDAIKKIKTLNPEFIFTDDNLNSLEITQKIKKKMNLKAISYVQILYGSHAIASCFENSSFTLKEKLLFNSIKFVPFSFFSARYSKLLKSYDLVIANSKITATLLHSLYNIEVTGIVYPPIDTEIFQPSDKKSKLEVTLYLGSHLGDAPRHFVKEIIAVLREEDVLVNLFGNERLVSEVVDKDDVLILYHSNLSDIELARMYSRSKLTICPQKWEQFGLVPVESMSCGTPVLAFNCMGFQETISDFTGWLANNEAEFLRMLNNALKKETFTIQELRRIAIEKFSIESSGKTLQELLEKYINPKI